MGDCAFERRGARRREDATQALLLLHEKLAYYPSKRLQNNGRTCKYEDIPVVCNTYIDILEKYRLADHNEHEERSAEFSDSSSVAFLGFSKYD